MSSTPGFPVSKIKVRVPYRRRELLVRTRLVEALFDQMEKRALLVVAPAGYGKTSLLVDLAQQCEMPVCWLSLDTLDEEPQRFLRYLIAAITERFPDFGQDSLAALESMSSFEEDEERLLVTLTNEINSQVNEHFLLILDDYHLVGNTPFIARMVGRFLQLAGEHVHLLLASRTLPDLPNAPLLIARNQVGGLTYKELSFLPEEIQQLFQQNNGIWLSQQDALALVEQTEGWIAAIYLTNGQPGSLPQMHPLESTRELFDFFSQEVLRHQPDQVRRFLLMTSQFDAFDVALCEKVLGPLTKGAQFDWTVLFEAVRMGNLFSVPLDHEGRWMRYHHLFQHFLRSQLQFEQSVLAWHIQQNLAHAYEEQCSWEDALQVYDRLGDYVNQVRVLTQTGAIFIASGRLLTLANWLEKLPHELLYAHPALVSLLGTLHTTRGDNLRALELLRLAESKLRESGNESAWLATLVRLAEVRRQLGRFEEALQDVEKILSLAGDSNDQDMQYTFAEAQRVKGLSLVGLGLLRDAQSWLEKAVQTSRSLGIMRNIPILETELGVVHRRLGETTITEQYYASALKAWETTGNTGWKARLLNNMGLLYHKTGRLEQAFIHLEESLKTAERSGYTRIQTNVLISLGDLLTDMFDFDLAYDYYDRALTLATHLGHSRYIFYSSLGQARLHRLNGDPLGAIDELRHAELSQVSLGAYERAISSMELGCCWLEAGKLESAIIAFGEAAAQLSEEDTSMERAVAQLWLAVAACRQTPESSISQICELLPPRREWQLPTQFMIAAGRAEHWMRRNGENRLFQDPILQKFFERAGELRVALPGLVGKQLEVPAEPAPKTPRLEILSFGEVRINHNGRPVNISDWQTREARELFLFLLHSRPLTKEQIALEFWPDISPARLKMRFKINMYRIRRALGQDVIRFENDRYEFNRKIDHSWDRAKVDELLPLLKDPSSAQRMDLLVQLTELLKNPYLEDVHAEWAVSDQLRYQDLYRDLMVELAGIHLNQGRNQECLEIAGMVLNSDPLREAAHRMIIQAHASLHNPTGMILQYRKYQETLMSELGIQPSREMNTFFEQLLDAI